MIDKAEFLIGKITETIDKKLDEIFDSIQIPESLDPEDLMENAEGRFKKVIDILDTEIHIIIGHSPGILDDIVGGISGAVDGFIDSASNFIDDIGKIFEASWNEFERMMGQIWGNTTKTIDDTINGIIDFGKKIAEGIGTSILLATDSLAKTIVKVFSLDPQSFVQFQKELAEIYKKEVKEIAGIGE
ncbi:MAG: hypothetical protein ACTSQ8_24765 [Candidatus Helarchaeota archaeon]